MSGSATLAMAVSSSSMNVASVTTTATTQGLIAGRVAPTLGTGMEAAAALMGALGSFDALRDRPVASNIWYNAISDQLVAGMAWWEVYMRKGEQTRQEIIRKAAPIFNQRGYDGAALSD